MIHLNLLPSTLTERLRERIASDGPITFRDWMESALYDDLDGYYQRKGRSPWGRQGDYRTSPERSELFAATFARYFAALYRTLDSPPGWTILEVGAGNGEFAQGVLRTLQDRYPDVFAATRYVIDDVGARPQLEDRFVSFGECVQFKSLAEVEPIDAGIIFSNELLDAFPVHRVTVSNGQLRELYVSAAPNGKFAWIIGPLSQSSLADYLAHAGITLAEGQLAEINLEIGSWLKHAAGKLLRGYLATVDYGAEASELYDSAVRPAGTLRGIYRHQLVDEFLTEPGAQDITSTIDWTHVKRVGQEVGLETITFERQDRFLLDAGLLQELELLTQRAASEAERAELSTTAREMILPNGMAASFQVLVQGKGVA
jgi:SAM-dependent MidA family methyltransferase